MFVHFDMGYCNLVLAGTIANRVILPVPVRPSRKAGPDEGSDMARQA
jgi:hypothetical protein